MVRIVGNIMVRGRISRINKEVYPYPSRYGSHRSMVVSQFGCVVVCKDEFGEYETTKDRLDNGLADPKRYSGRN